MTALLASVCSVAEARAAATAGADLIDLKDPRRGALGALPLHEIMSIVVQLRAHWPIKPISATIGDVPFHQLDTIAQYALETAGTGVDYVKVGIAPGPFARDGLARLATLPARVVPVLLCDDGVTADLVRYAASLGFAGVMFDTARKQGRTLFDCVAFDTLATLLELAAAHGALTGIAGALGVAQLPAIQALAPDFAGFRTALCIGGRTATLDPDRVRSLRAALHEAPPIPLTSPPH
jgi:uncharacterized protein (UPF0264 family)